MRIAIVTGASSGMGRDFVKLIDKKLVSIDEIWVIARRAERLKLLQQEVSVKLVPIEMDLLQDNMSVLKYLLKEKKASVKLLINCAGYGKIGNYQEIPYEDELNMVQLNCKALTAVTYTVLPFMHTDSRIVQFASAAAFMPQPCFAVYAATKSYVLSFSRALNEELKGTEISVTAVCPGPVKTEFFEIAESNASVAFYKKLMMADSKKVVEKAFRDAIRRKPVSVYGGLMNAFRLLMKVVPHGTAVKFIR